VGTVLNLRFALTTEHHWATQPRCMLYICAVIQERSSPYQ
jgi:hypothetical protein